MIHLIGNAIKFTPKGGVVVRAALESPTPAGWTVRVSVVDTGIGIPKEHQARIFEPFVQVDSSATRRYGGTGLGLAIASQLTRLMGGRIWVESEPGHGSVFHFAVPVEKPAVEFGSAPVLLDLSVPLRVLVIDDNAGNRHLLEERLKGWGMQPVTVNSGAVALTALVLAKKAGPPFALVLLDESLPGVDVFELACRLRDSQEPPPAVILMRGTPSSQDDAAVYRQMGIAGLVTKPVSHRDLVAAIQQAGVTRPAAPGADAVEETLTLQ